MALLGFVSSAADYLKDRINVEGDEIKELTDIDFDDLKKELLDNLSASFNGGESNVADMINAGRSAFDHLFKENVKTPLMNEFDDLFNVDFGNERKDREMQNHLLELLKQPGYSEEYRIIASAAEKQEEKEETKLPGDSEKIDHLFTQILDSENRNTGSLSEFDDEPENFEEKIEAEEKLDEEMDMRPLSERLRAFANGDEFSEAEMDRLYRELDLSEIKREREEKLREKEADKSLSRMLKDTKHKDVNKADEPYVSEGKMETAPKEEKVRYHQTLSDLLREVKESDGIIKEENNNEIAEFEKEEEITSFDNEEKALADTEEMIPAEEDTVPVEEEKTPAEEETEIIDIDRNLTVFGDDYVPEEEDKETRTVDPIEEMYIFNPGSERLEEQETAELEEEGSAKEESEDKEEHEDSEDIEDFMGELINGLSTNTIAQRIENIRKEEEDAKSAVYESIKAIYPYLSDSFIRGVYDLKGSLAYDYPEDEEIVILHRLNFRDVEGLRNFVEVILAHGYAVNVDEKQMIVDVFKSHVNTDGRILTDIFEIANQAKLLDGEYEGYKIIENDEVDF